MKINKERLTRDIASQKQGKSSNKKPIKEMVRIIKHQNYQGGNKVKTIYFKGQVKKLKIEKIYST